MPRCERKADKLSIHTQFHVAFAPNFGPADLPFASQRGNVLPISRPLSRIMEHGHIFRAGIRDAKQGDL